MKKSIQFTAALCLLFPFANPQIAAASQKPSVNDMSACQATADFVTAKVVSLKGKYAEADVAAVTGPLESYSEFLQRDHITPGLIEFNGGDIGKAKAMQAQVSEYQGQIKTALEQKFGGDRVFTDQAMSLDGCYTKAPMSEAMTPKMTTALQTLVKLAMMK